MATTTRRQRSGLDASARFSSSFASSLNKNTYAPQAAYSPAQIVEEWTRYFGSDSDLFEPSFTPLQVKQQLEVRTAEVVRLRAEAAELKRRAYKEQQEFKTQVTFFAAAARSAARQAKAECTDSMRRVHDRELARLKALVEALERQQQQQQQQQHPQQQPQQQEHQQQHSFSRPAPPPSARPQSSSARLQSTSSSPFKAPAGRRRDDKESEEKGPRSLPQPSLNFPVQSPEEQTLLEKRLAALQELYEVTRVAMQVTATTTAMSARAGERSGGKEGKEEEEKREEVSEKGLDFTLGSVDVYPGQTAARTTGMGVDEEEQGGGCGGGGGGRGGGGWLRKGRGGGSGGRGVRAAAAAAAAAAGGGAAAERTSTIRGTTTAGQVRGSAIKSSNIFGDRAYTRLDPTQYPTSMAAAPPPPPPRRRSAAGLLQEARDMRGIFQPSVTEEEEGEMEEEEEEESEEEEEESSSEEGESEEEEESSDGEEDDDFGEEEGEEESGSETESEEGEWSEDEEEEDY